MPQRRVHFPQPFEHNHPPIQDVNDLFAKQEQQFGWGPRAADWVVSLVGSWRFIIVQSALLVLWIVVNTVAIFGHWDPYPFILMNLVLSTQAAFTAPIIMMSQNRQAEKDRLEMHNDYLVNQKSEEEVRAVLDHLVAQDQALQLLLDRLDALEAHLPKP